jgi:hypothetical protein
VQSPTGLTLRRPQIGLEPPAVAPISVPVPVNRGEHGVPIPVPDEELEPPPVKHPPMRGKERSSGIQINSHATHSVEAASQGLEGFGPGS